MTNSNEQTTTGTEDIPQGAREAASALRGLDNLLLASHVRPDGDCLGSTCALALALAAMGKRVAAFNPSPIPSKLRFLPGIHFVSDTMPQWKPDTTVFLDCGGPDRVTPDFKPIGFTFNIDHHSTNEMFGDVNYVDSRACAVGEQVVQILRALDAPITPGMATALYTAIITDTGGFRYSNTNALTFETAACLARAGADIERVGLEVFESRRPQELDLIGRVYSRMKYECSGRLVWSEIRWTDYEEVGGEEYEPEGLAGDIRAVNSVEVSILFHELSNGGLRAGFRGKGRIDCAAIAHGLGGGGHFNASGYYNDKTQYERERQRVLQAARERILKELGGDGC